MDPGDSLLSLDLVGRGVCLLKAKLDEAVVRLHLSWGLEGPGPQSRLKACALGWHSPLGGLSRQGEGESRLLAPSSRSGHWALH